MGVVFLFGGYGSFAWGVWYFYLGGMVLYIYLGSRVCLVEGYGSFIWGVYVYAIVLYR